jgi:PAS domain S-box-containing protein
MYKKDKKIGEKTEKSIKSIDSVQKKYVQNQKRLRQIIDLVPHLIFLKDTEGKILMANKAFARFYDTKIKKLVCSNIADYHLNKDELKKILEEDKLVIESKERIELDDIELTDARGEKKIYKLTKIPYVDPITGEISALGISIDVTEQRNAEKAEYEAKEKYRLLVERGNDGIIILQEDHVVFANNQAASIFGVSQQEIRNKNIADFIGQSELNKLSNNYIENTKNKEANPFYESHFFKPDGSVCYIEIKINAINLNSVKSYFLFIQDITKRKLAEQLRERDKNMLEQAQAISKLGSWELNVAKKEVFSSKEIFRILEVDDDYKPTGVNWFMDFIPKEERKEIFKAFLQTFKTQKHCEHQFPIITAKGNRKIIQSQRKVYKNKQGKVTHIIGSWLDITERVKIEEQLKIAKAMAEESDKLKSAFLANMSHEIRTPMNAILGFANLLKMPDIEENLKLEYLNHIIQSGDNLLNLINDIIDISKIEAGQLNIEKHAVDVNQLLDQLYNRYEELIALNHPGEIVLNLKKAVHNKIVKTETDPYRLQQIISNLLNNAIKFTKEGEIEFGYHIEGSDLKFFVRDSGIGIPKDKQAFIFKRFGKLEDPAKINLSGTGLGLSISKSLAVLLGGDLNLNSEYNAGAEFFFNIPLLKPKTDKLSKGIQKTAKGVKLPKLNKRVILIAEDDILNYKLLETLVKRTGADVVWAKNGIQAVEFIETRKDIDLVFMDIKMPKMNGYDATRKIKKLNPGIPVIAQTAFAFANEKTKILKSGCNKYLKKPLQKDEIYKVLIDYLVEK